MFPWIFWTLLQLAQGAEFAQPPLPATFTPYPAATQGDVQALGTYKALTCIQDEAKQDLFFNPSHKAASCMIRSLAPSLEKSFRRHQMSPAEISLFLSQALEESHFFTHLAETRDVNSQARGDCGSDQHTLDHLIMSVNATASKTGTTRYAGKNVGAGLIQLTGFDNRVSALDYLVQELDEKSPNPQWKQYWEFPDPKNPSTKIKLDAKTASPTTSESFRSYYRSAYRPGKDINIYDLYSQQELMSTPNWTLNDRKLGDMNSNTILIELAMAYWHGRCQGEMAKVANQTGYVSPLYPATKYSSPQERAVRSATVCVHGSDRDDKDIQRRLQWFELARSCVRRHMGPR